MDGYGHVLAYLERLFNCLFIFVVSKKIFFYFFFKLFFPLFFLFVVFFYGQPRSLEKTSFLFFICSIAVC